MPIAQYGSGMELTRRTLFRNARKLLSFPRRSRAFQPAQSGTQELVSGARDRVARRIQSQKAEFRDAQGRDRYRELGDILSANLYALEKGMTRAQLSDIFDPEGKTVEITLDARLTPQQNMAGYYKRYARAKKRGRKAFRADKAGRGRTGLP
jgi:predicted ribosome quality control (RQC) complex YloA/Tae2 family protein